MFLLLLLFGLLSPSATNTTNRRRVIKHTAWSPFFQYVGSPFSLKDLAVPEVKVLARPYVSRLTHVQEKESGSIEFFSRYCFKYMKS